MKYALLFIAALAPTSLAKASDTIHWKTVGGWAIRMDSSMGNACYVSNLFNDGTILRLGFDFRNNNRGLYFSLGNQKWKSLEDGKDYPVTIIFDNNPPWNATARGMNVDEISYLHIVTNDPSFADDFSRKLSVRAYYAGKEITALNLSGSKKAIDEMVDCQKTTSQYMAQHPNPPTNTDPFAPNTSVKASDDPFAL